MDRRKTRIRKDLCDGFGIRKRGWFVPLQLSDIDRPVSRTHDWCYVIAHKVQMAGVIRSDVYTITLHKRGYDET